jgi:hypothetical protein
MAECDNSHDYAIKTYATFIYHKINYTNIVKNDEFCHLCENVAQLRVESPLTYASFVVAEY